MNQLGNEPAPVGRPGLLAGASAPEQSYSSIPRPAFAWRTRLALPAALLLGMASLLAYTAGGALLPAAEVRVVPVVVQTTSGAPAAGSVVAQATGWVEPDPYAIVVNALADGIVSEVLVLEGDAVEANQAVARLIEDEARIALAVAQAEVARATAQHAAAQRTWDNPIDRQEAISVAAAGLAELEAELAALGPTIEAEEARLEELAGLFAQVEQSYNSGAATETEYTIARQRLASQRATVAATRARQPVLEAQLASGRAELLAAEENGRLRIEEAANLEVARAELQLAEARRAEARLRLDRMMVRAPAAGVVMTRHAEAGAKVMLGMDDPLSSAIVRLYNPRKLQVRVDVPLADAAKVGVGMEAEVIVGVLPDRTFKGRVTRVVNEADVARNTLQVKVVIEDPDPNLKPEMLARVRFLAAPGEQDAGSAAESLGVFAPESLVRQEPGGGASVLVVNRESGTAVLRKLALGTERKEGWVQIASGLAPGDRIIADPPPALRDGARIRVVGEADLGEGGA